MLGRAASCCDLLRLSPTPGDSSEDVSFYVRTVHALYAYVSLYYIRVCIYVYRDVCMYVCIYIYIHIYIHTYTYIDVSIHVLSVRGLI